MVAAGLVSPYLSLQLRTLGLSLTDNSFVNGLAPVVVAVVTPALGYLGDKVGYRNVLIFVLLGNLFVSP